MSSVEPRCGIEAGGTKLILKGTNLTIGSDVSVNVGGSPCEITGDRHHDSVSLVEIETNVSKLFQYETTQTHVLYSKYYYRITI